MQNLCKNNSLGLNLRSETTRTAIKSEVSFLSALFHSDPNTADEAVKVFFFMSKICNPAGICI